MKDPNHGDTIWLEPMTISRPKLTPPQLVRLAEGDDKAQLTAAIEKHRGKAKTSGGGGVACSGQLQELFIGTIDDTTISGIDLFVRVEKLLQDYTGPEDATAIRLRKIWRETKIDFHSESLAKLKGEYQAANKVSIVVLAVSEGLAEKVAANPNRLTLKVQGKDNVTKFETVFVVG